MKKDIKGYKYYYATDNGEIYSKDRVITMLNPNTKEEMSFVRKGRKLLQKVTKSGYCAVCLSENNTKKYYFVHRLIAEAFIPNPDNLPQVNHINEDKQDNCVSNLEWCTGNYNYFYGTGLDRRKNNQKVKAVSQYNLDNTYVNSFSSINEAERVTKIKHYNISFVCKGKRKTAGGYIWRYK